MVDNTVEITGISEHNNLNMASVDNAFKSSYEQLNTCQMTNNGIECSKGTNISFSTVGNNNITSAPEEVQTETLLVTNISEEEQPKNKSFCKKILHFTIFITIMYVIFAMMTNRPIIPPKLIETLESVFPDSQSGGSILSDTSSELLSNVGTLSATSSSLQTGISYGATSALTDTLVDTANVSPTSVFSSMASAPLPKTLPFTPEM